jgi:2,3-bisphosphoglycerate-independent phosphoglycerate mutase
VVFRGKGLCDALSDGDPQKEGVPPLAIKPHNAKAKSSAVIVNEFIKQAKSVLKDQPKANMILMRGFALPPVIPSMHELYKLKSAALAVYPMYKGLAHLVGMQVIDGLMSINDQAAALKKHYNDNTFFFIHHKKTDSYGEDGNFDAKVHASEDFDTLVGEVMNMAPDCVVITGDHSTPSALKSHSWHEVPTLVYSKYARKDGLPRVNEQECRKGSLGVFPAQDLLAIALGNALKLEKFGA